MSLILERPLVPPTGYLNPPDDEGAGPRVNISVVFTFAEATVSALKQAGALAQRVSARIRLVVMQVVPYPLPLTSPPVLLDFSEKRFEAVAAASPVETRVHLYLCRDRWEALQNVLEPRSVVALGGRKRWWPTAEQALARRLRRAGHEVIFIETE